MSMNFFKTGIIIVTLLSTADCLAAAPEYYYFDPSRIAVKTVFDRNGKIIGTQEYTAIDTTSGNAFGNNMIAKNGSDTEITESRYVIQDNGLRISMGKNTGGEEIFLDYPAQDITSTGVISHTEFETAARLAGKNIRVYCTVTNRRVTAVSETVSSEAGTWNCTRVEYDMELKGKVFGIGIPVHVHIIEWFAPGVGIVRTDVYWRGKLHETRLLTGFKNISS